MNVRVLLKNIKLLQIESEVSEQIVFSVVISGGDGDICPAAGIKAPNI